MQTAITTITLNISAVTEMFERGEINETEYNTLISSLTDSLSNKTSELQDLEQKQNNTTEQLIDTLGKTQNIEQGREREEEVKSPVIVHLAGFFTAFAYIFIFRRDILWSLPDNMPFMGKVHFKKKQKSKSKPKKREGSG